MVALPETFAPNEVPEDDRNFEPIPAGTYKLQVIESKIEDTKSGTGQMLTLTLEVVEGPYTNRRIWDRLNIRNENPDAQRIAQRSLADLCLQLGIPQLRDTDNLHFKPFMGRVTIQPDKSGQYGPQNRVRYSSAGKGQPPAGKGAPVQRAAQPQQRQAAAPSGAKPWNNPKPAQKADLDDEIPF